MKTNPPRVILRLPVILLAYAVVAPSCAVAKPWAGYSQNSERGVAVVHLDSTQNLAALNGFVPPRLASRSSPDGDASASDAARINLQRQARDMLSRGPIVAVSRNDGDDMCYSVGVALIPLDPAGGSKARYVSSTGAAEVPLSQAMVRKVRLAATANLTDAMRTLADLFDGVQGEAGR